MISSIRGSVLSVTATSAIVEVGGIGLSITVTPAHALSLRVGVEASVFTALIVKEDDLALFGFADTEQLHAFDLLRGVTGVGPKSAMGVLSAMTPDDVARAVNTDDDAAFRKVSGIGPKTAKLIVVSLTGKMVAPPTASRMASPATTVSVVRSVVDALVGLGWSEKAAEQAAEDARDAVGQVGAGSAQAMLRMALAQLGPAQTSPRGNQR